MSRGTTQGSVAQRRSAAKETGGASAHGGSTQDGLETLGSRLDTATGHLPGPLAVIDLDALEANASDLVTRAGGTPVRLASKSVRVRSIIDSVLKRPGWAGVMAYSLSEALWLVARGHTNILLGYPMVNRAALAEFLAWPEARRAITLMLDDVEQARLILEVAEGGPGPLHSEALSGTQGSRPLGELRTTRTGAGDRMTASARIVSKADDPPVQVCLDVDSSWKPGIGPFRLHLGARRSPLHKPSDVAAVAKQIEALGGFRVRGLMFYEAQVAGLPDSSLAVRMVKRCSIADLAQRKSAVVRAVAQVIGREPDLINSGGTGSIETSSADAVVTEVAAGSGLLLPVLFDDYRTVTPRPAAFFGLDVVRHPNRRMATAFAGGYVASGPAGKSRLPTPVWPIGSRLTGSEAAGEVQTPLRLRRKDEVAIGERVWFRHAKAGELMERFTQVHLVRGDRLIETVPTYRGEGKSFG